VQTLKTGAIVILLMTVVFSAYTSLTTPPERLPDEVAGALDLDTTGDFLAIDEGLPPSLADIGLSEDEMAAGVSDSSGLNKPGAANEGSFASGNATGLPNATDSSPALMALNAPASLGAPTTAQTSSTPGKSTPVNLGSSGSQDGGFSMALSDQSKSAQSAQASMGQLSAQPASSLKNSMSLPPIENGNPSSGQGLPNSVPQSYPATNQEFSLPDPSLLNASPTGEVTPSASNWQSQPAQASIASQSMTGQPLISQVSATSVGTSVNRDQQIRGLVNAIKTADRQYSEDRLREALATLSYFYGTPDLTGEQRSELLGRLDALAAQVIYSRRHLLETAHRIAPNQTLMQVADEYQIPWQLLANINGVRDPVAIVPGTELKVVRGPFRAEVDTKSNEMTLFLGDLYAGRFIISVNNEPRPVAGTYTVQDKQSSRTFYDKTGAAIPAGSADNPYGNVWIDLGGQTCIHGSPSMKAPASRGCISLSSDTADDLYSILSLGSSVLIR
jgi:lipoprotein-anchoring transpeptidase ErfK/SrfK